MNLVNIIAVLVIIFTIKVETYRILGVFPLAFRSHNFLFHALMKGLAKRGHQVDVISHYELSNPPKNYKTILNLSKQLILANSSYGYGYGYYKKNVDNNDITDFVSFVSPNGLACNIMADEQMQKFIQNPPKNPSYDVLITEALATNCFYGLGVLLKVPVVSVSACLEIPPHSKNVGNPPSTSFFPSIVYKKFEIKTFWDRLQNTLLTLTEGYKYNSLSESQSEVMRKYLSPSMPSVREVEKKLSLLLMNTYHTLHGVRPKLPAFIEVGGLHIEEDDSNFNPYVKQWMDDSKNGVILLSLGSEAPIETLPRETIRSIFSSLLKLSPMRVLIKVTDGSKLPFDHPENCLIMTWIPQIPVLKHPNTRLFITHGGLHSIMEAVYFGIPIIGIPLYYDQQQNVEMMVAKNIGLEQNYKEITEQSFDAALQKVLTDPKFRNAMKYESHMFRDRPLNPLDTAIYWVEYVIKHGANSLRSPSIDTYWWQIDQLDVYGFLLLCITLIFFAITAVAVNIYKRFRCKNETDFGTDSKKD